MADNDPKHTSNRAKEFIEDTGINWWRTPAWSREYLARAKGIFEKRSETKDKRSVSEWYWNVSVDVRKCQKYIRHLHKVFPWLYKDKGGATGHWVFLFVLNGSSKICHIYKRYTLNLQLIHVHVYVYCKYN